MLEIKNSTIEDAVELSKNLRKEDIEELKLSDKTPLIALLEGYIFSEECYSAFVDGELSGMFGIGSINMPDNWGSIWFLGSDKILKVRREWIKLGKYYITSFLNKYKILTNYVDIRNIKHIYWLKKMGALFLDTVPVKEGSLINFIIYKRGE